MPTSKKAVKIIRRRKTSLKNKKYYAGDYSEQIINGTPVKCIYPDSSDKSIAAMLGFRKNCTAIPGFTPPVTPVEEKPLEEKPVEDVVTPTQVDIEPMSNSVPYETAPVPTPIQEEPAPAPTPVLVETAPAPMMMPMFYTNVKQPKGGSKRKSKKSKKSSKNNSKKSKKSKK
jgi:hypothetical protein